MIGVPQVLRDIFDRKILLDGRSGVPKLCSCQFIWKSEHSKPSKPDHITLPLSSKISSISYRFWTDSSGSRHIWKSELRKQGEFLERGGFLDLYRLILPFCLFTKKLISVPSPDSSCIIISSRVLHTVEGSEFRSVFSGVKFTKGTLSIFPTLHSTCNTKRSLHSISVYRSTE